MKKRGPVAPFDLVTEREPVGREVVPGKPRSLQLRGDLVGLHQRDDFAGCDADAPVDAVP